MLWFETNRSSAVAPARHAALLVTSVTPAVAPGPAQARARARLLTFMFKQGNKAYRSFDLLLASVSITLPHLPASISPQ